MDAYTEPRVRLEPAVSEEWLRQVALAGHSPNDFASWVLERVDVQELLRDYGGGGDAEPVETSPTTRATTSSLGSTIKVKDESQVSVTPRDRQSRWTKALFFDFLEVVTSVEDMAASSRLLGAYVRLGPVPSSQALMELCGFDDEGEWQTALRVAKQRLTIEARRMESPPLFRRAKAGKEEGQRLHPIEPILFGWLKEWGRVRTDTNQPEDAFPDPERWGWDLSVGASKGRES